MPSASPELLVGFTIGAALCLGSVATLIYSALVGQRNKGANKSMRPEYIPAANDLNGLLVHASEECSEVIKAACKIQRFGVYFVTPEGNRLDYKKDLINEIGDAKVAMDRLLACLTT